MNGTLPKTMTETLPNGQEANFTLMEDSQTYLPTLELPEQKEIGIYGRMRLAYLKEHRKALYQSLLLKGTLNDHLAETDKTARQRLELMLPQMLEKAGVTEQLKAQNQMEWVGLTNSVKQAAEEMIQAELIYN